MNKQQVDALVQAAIENLQAGRTVEDDAGIEFKGEWPDPASKARQLAGAANALRGGTLIYVVGVDDKTGAITVPIKTEPQDWYAQTKMPFDQVAPELLWIQTVYVGEKSESVLALVFDTSDFPYMVNLDSRRDIPMRVGSSTKSAHRNQVVRMFEPSLRPPAMSITIAECIVFWDDSPRLVKGSEPPETFRLLKLVISLSGRVLIEHFGDHPTTLPVRDMRGRLSCGDFEVRPEVEVRNFGAPQGFSISAIRNPPPEPTPPQYGVYARDKHVIATSPGEFSFSMSESYEGVAPDQTLGDMYDRFTAAGQMSLDLSLRVVGVQSRLKLACLLERTKEVADLKPNKHPHGESMTGRLGEWNLQVDDVDPWE